MTFVLQFYEDCFSKIYLSNASLPVFYTFGLISIGVAFDEMILPYLTGYPRIVVIGIQ